MPWALSHWITDFVLLQGNKIFDEMLQHNEGAENPIGLKNVTW